MQRSLFKKVQNYLQKKILLPYHTLTQIPIHIHNDTEIPQIENFESRRSLILELARGTPNTELALHEASQMLNSGTKPTGYTLVYLVRASAKLGWETYGQQLHSYIFKSGFGSNVFVSTALINFYLRIGSLSEAYKMFVEMSRPSVVSWNSLISGYVHSGHFGKALGLFIQLDRSEICVDAFSFTAALSACGQLSLLQLGESIHCKIVKFGQEFSVVVANCLIDMYGKCGFVGEAIQVFQEINDKDIISWNSVIAASARNQNLEQAFSFLHQMPNPDTISYNEVINGIAQFGKIEDATKILWNMPNPNSSSWNSIITGYVNQNQAWEAWGFFTKMHWEGIEMDQFTFSSILSGIAGLAALTVGTLIHCCTVKCGLDTAIFVGSALIDMYSKCGQVKSAELLFQLLPKRNLVTWNAMISGFAHNGESTKVIHLFKELQMMRDLRPDDITFLNVLSACSHNQMPVEIAIQCFKTMTNDYGIQPTTEHCCSMIRLMGQRGEAWKAGKMISELGFQSCGVVWNALLGACGASKDLKVAKIAAAKVIELEGDDDYVYVMISNIYACYEKWGDVSVVRKLMREKGVRKEAACSWIAVENVTPNS